MEIVLSAFDAGVQVLLFTGRTTLPHDPAEEAQFLLFMNYEKISGLKMKVAGSD